MLTNFNCTPQELIDALSLIDKPLIEMPEYSLTKYVTETSNNYRIPMSAFQTGKYRVIQIYTCRYGGQSRSANSVKTDCPCHLKYEIKNGRATLKSAEWNHNHPINREYYDAHFSCLTKNEKLLICEQQKDGVPPGQIRSNLSITSNKDIFYSIRRATISQTKRETYDSLKEATNNKEFSTVFKKDENGTLKMMITLNKYIASMSYSGDYAITDDTSSTNIYDQNLHVVIVIDQENKSQLLSFGTLMDKTTNGYFEYFNTLKNMHNKSPRIFVVDRSYPQLIALKNVYPNSIIVFCHIHIGRDLEKHFSVEDDIVKYWYMMNKNISVVNEFIELIKYRVSKSQDFPGRKALIELLKTQEHWNPLILIQKGCYFNWNTNRVEGFFGTFKQHYGFKRITLTKLILNLMTHAKLMIVQSIKSYNSTNNLYSNYTCFIKDDIPYIGKLALDVIASEYNEYLNNNDNSPFCALCNLRLACPELELPCRHTFCMSNIPISKNMLHSRYLRVDNIINYDENEINQHEEIIQTSQKWEYKDIMAKISPYASIANKSELVQNILNETIINLEKTKTVTNEGMPLCLNIKGRLQEHPSNNVILGKKPREHRRYKCSICGQYGHNKKLCKNKKNLL